MRNVNYANIANKLLGNDLYCKFIKEISKDNKGANLVDYGKDVIEKSCFLIVMLGMSKVKLDTVKICLDDEMIEINTKEFAEKYKQYTQKIECDIMEKVKIYD